jgi:hypothetical protein
VKNWGGKQRPKFGKKTPGWWYGEISRTVIGGLKKYRCDDGGKMRKFSKNE